MVIASTVSRVILGIAFILFGIMPFVFPNPPSQPGLTGEFTVLFFRSHWILFIAFAQLVSGVLLLADRFVPVALIVLAGFLYNSLAYHLLTSPALLPMPVLVVVLYLLVALRYRSLFAPIFAARPPRD